MQQEIEKHFTTFTTTQKKDSHQIQFRKQETYANIGTVSCTCGWRHPDLVHKQQFNDVILAHRIDVIAAKMNIEFY